MTPARHEPAPPALEVVRACLATRERPRPAAWAAIAAEPAVLRHPVVRRAGLIPQLLHAADQAGVRIEAGRQSEWRAARLHAELRLAAILPVCREALDRCDSPAVVLRGVALSHSVYDEPVLRHCHDLDLLVNGRPRTIVHEQGFPVVRHESLFPGAPVPVTWADVQADTAAIEIAGLRARVLAPADALIHVCVHAATQGRAHGPLWCLDAALLIRHFSAHDWDRVTTRALAWKLSPRVHRALAWLTSRFDLSVPSVSLDELAPRRWWSPRRRRPLNV